MHRRCPPCGAYSNSDQCSHAWNSFVLPALPGQYRDSSNSAGQGCDTLRHQLLVLLVLEFRNLDLDGLFNTALQLSTVPKLEEHLEPDEQRGEEDGLE